MIICPLFRHYFRIRMTRNMRGITNSPLNDCRRLHLTINDLQNSVESLHGQYCTMNRSMNQITQRIDRNPVNMMHWAAAARTEERLQQPTNVCNTNSNATLLPHPRSLQQLWEEYTTGVGGRKVAKDFTSYKRGQDKHKYCHWKVMWDLIAAHVRVGKLASRTIDLIYTIYGSNSSVTQIINGIKEDKKYKRSNPQLVV